jgi:hypothetical protein
VTGGPECALKEAACRWRGCAPESGRTGSRKQAVSSFDKFISPAAAATTEPFTFAAGWPRSAPVVADWTPIERRRTAPAPLCVQLERAAGPPPPPGRRRRPFQAACGADDLSGSRRLACARRHGPVCLTLAKKNALVCVSILVAVVVTMRTAATRDSDLARSRLALA